MISKCPCGSEAAFADCCQPILEGSPAPSAEALVRSRYTAFVVKNLDHVERTHAPEVRDDFNRAEAERLAQDCEWGNLRIHRATEIGDTAEVEFVVKFRRENRLVTGATASKFRREQGQWLYVSSKPAPHIANLRIGPKVGRNDQCPCNSGKKYKKCCLESEAV